MSPPVFWPSALGLMGFTLGLRTYRRDLFDSASFGAWMRAIGPVFIAAAIAAFSGEHFTDAVDFVRLVPGWLPLRMPITYLVGVALLAAGLSIAGKVAVRWSTPWLAVLFALFVLLIHLPNAIQRAGTRIFWIFPFREGTFAIGALSLHVATARPSWSRRPGGFSLFARVWAAIVAVFFGSQNLGYPQLAPGVPSQRPTSAWVPLPHVVAYATGAILVALGLAAVFKRTAVAAITWVGVLMAGLTLLLFVPDLFLAKGPGQPITAINFVADTLLFSGSMLAIALAISDTTLGSSDEVAGGMSLSSLQMTSSDVASTGSIV